MVDITKVTDAKSVDQKLSGLPKGLSFFDPILLHEAKEELESGGEVYLSEGQDGGKNGLFVYDGYEATGTIFTKSREVFDRFFALKPSSYIFSELEVKEHQKEDWSVWQLDVDRSRADHRFKHHVSMENNAKEIEDFMAINQPETNRQWVSVALKNGDKCFVVRVLNRIVGIAWMSIVDGFARSHSLYVEPNFRRRGITRDIFHARLIYLKSKRVHTLINEIADSNVASSGHAKEIGEKIVGKIYLYTSPDSEDPA
jgi:L-amino acid N-acyltransferase YncA